MGGSFHRREAVGGRARHHRRDDPRELGAHAASDLVERADRPGERHSRVDPGEELVAREAERVLIGGRVRGRPLELFGCHVAWSSENLTHEGLEVARLLLDRRGLGQPEVEDLHDALLGDHDVARLHVAVHEPGPVRGPERTRRIDEPRHLGVDRDPAFTEVMAKRDSADELHRDVRDALGLAELVDRHRIGVVQRCGRAGLTKEPGGTPGVRDGHRGLTVRAEHLQRDGPVKAGVDRPIHLAHATAADQALDLVAFERRSRREGQPVEVTSPARSLRCRRRPGFAVKGLPEA